VEVLEEREKVVVLVNKGKMGKTSEPKGGRVWIKGRVKWFRQVRVVG
jgi:hypothetical protein